MPDSAHGSLWLILHWHFECVICALLMWLPFFSGAIPTYGVLPYAMIGITTLWHLCVHIKIDVAWYSMITFCVNMKGECDNDARKLIAMMEWCRDLGLHTETFQNTCTLEVVLYEFRHRFGVVIELNHPHCSKRLHYTQLQIDRSYLLTVTKLLAYLVSIPLMKLLAKKVFVYICSVQSENYAILRLRCAFSESQDCIPILRLCTIQWIPDVLQCEYSNHCA